MEDKEKKYNYIYEIILILSIVILLIMGAKTYFDKQSELIFNKYNSQSK